MAVSTQRPATGERCSASAGVVRTSAPPFRISRRNMSHRDSDDALQFLLHECYSNATGRGLKQCSWDGSLGMLTISVSLVLASMTTWAYTWLVGQSISGGQTMIYVGCLETSSVSTPS